MSTRIGIDKQSFVINGRPVYADEAPHNPAAHGLLMNARFIQGIFDDAANPRRFDRFGRAFSPERNTSDLIAALPRWYEVGLRAFTVGFQGGGPCFTTNNATIENNPYGPNGTQLDPAYAGRMDRLIRAADAIGMVVIVNFLYCSQARRLSDAQAVRNAVTTASRFLREGAYTNVFIDVANEHNIDLFDPHKIITSAEGMRELIGIAQRESGGIAVGSSIAGEHIEKSLCDAADIVLIHGNSLSRQQFQNLIVKCRSYAPHKPIICNEDSAALSNLRVAVDAGVSWGYYNNLTKQEPPTDWTITPGEDTFFAYRTAEAIGISLPELPENEHYLLQGLEPEMTVDGKRWIRLASLYPERIDKVDFYRNGKLYYTAYDDPFPINFCANWMFGPVLGEAEAAEWRAVVKLRNGDEIEKFASEKTRKETVPA